MKSKLLILGLSLGLAILGGCNDDLSLVGTSIQPESDRPIVYVDSFLVDANTVLMDSIYAKTTNGLLGNIYDPLYGSIKSDYLCQFYCPENYKFRYTPYQGRIDSMDVKILYASWLGDSLAPMEVKVYPITKAPERNFYTHIDPSQFCDMNKALGGKMYTAYDLSIPDSIRNITSSSNPNYYIPHIRVKLPTELGQKFYDETKNNPESFKNQDAFNKFFPGFYITNTFGSGTLLTVYQTSFNIYYKHTVKGSSGQDSLVFAKEQFNVTKEVIQLNHIKNANIESLLEPDDKYTYMKSPAGVYTELCFPIDEIKKTMGNRIINNMPLSLHAMPQEEWKYALTAPSYLLLLPTDSVKTFFENNQIENNKTSFLSNPYNAHTRTYTFGNISNIIQNEINNGKNKILKLSIVPVNRITRTNNYDQSEYTVSINNYMFPSGVKLIKSENYMKLGITSSQYPEKK